MDRTLINDELITIVAGQGSSRYKVQRALLTSSSDWFKAALSERFKEGQERILTLPEAEPAVVEDFLYWLYHGRVQFETEPYANLDCKEDNSDEEETSYVQRHTQRCTHAIRVWAFAEARFIPHLQNCAMEELYNDILTRDPSVEVIQAGYELTPPGSAVRRLLMKKVLDGLRRNVNQKIADGERGYAYQLRDLEPLGPVPGFMLDLAKVLTNGLTNIPPYTAIGRNGRKGYMVSEDTQCTHGLKAF